MTQSDPTTSNRSAAPRHALPTPPLSPAPADRVEDAAVVLDQAGMTYTCLLYTSPSPRDRG